MHGWYSREVFVAVKFCSYRMSAGKEQLLQRTVAWYQLTRDNIPVLSRLASSQIPEKVISSDK